jgi:hypothetical protein
MLGLSRLQLPHNAMTKLGQDVLRDIAKCPASWIGKCAVVLLAFAVIGGFRWR